MHPLVNLAKETVESYVREGAIPMPSPMTPEMRERAGVFVSIKKFGQLRGCIGTFEPTRANVAEETIMNAISSATRDPRFYPVPPEELPFLTYSVDVLTKPEPVKHTHLLHPRHYGLIVECRGRRGLLLPDLDGVETVMEQIDICCQKAGIYPNEPMQLYCFQVRRYT
ncbi:MAG: AmmeMemoRadiSam system protein A [Chloroflexi bacterium]|nr:AmmeMemoRadiSam system protein A [Chloroflexota bacterium]